MKNEFIASLIIAIVIITAIVYQFSSKASTQPRRYQYRKQIPVYAPGEPSDYDVLFNK